MVVIYMCIFVNTIRTLNVLPKLERISIFVTYVTKF